MMNMVDISASAKVNFKNLKDQYLFQMSMIHMIVDWTRHYSERREKKVAASSNAISNSIHLLPLLKVIWSVIDIFLNKSMQSVSFKSSLHQHIYAILQSF